MKLKNIGPAPYESTAKLGRTFVKEGYSVITYAPDVLFVGQKDIECVTNIKEDIVGILEDKGLKVEEDIERFDENHPGEVFLEISAPEDGVNMPGYLITCIDQDIDFPVDLLRD